MDFSCCSLPPGRLEFELFGYEKGSIRGASRSRAGVLERAHGGTLFLDAVTELPQALQAELLHVLEHRRVRRRGSTREKPFDVSIMTATHQDLKETIDYHRRCREAFNVRENKNWAMEALYQQLGKLELLIPPLPERPDVIVPLAQHSLARVSFRYHLPPKYLTSDARRALLAYYWPGNVRELKNMMEIIAVSFADNVIITAGMLALPDWSSISRRTALDSPR